MHMSLLLVSLCLACKYSHFSLLLATRDILPYAATQVQQFQFFFFKVGVATTVGKRG